MQEIYKKIKAYKEDLDDPEVRAPMFGAMYRGKSFITNFLLLNAHSKTREINSFNSPLPSYASVSAASKVPVRVRLCWSEKAEVRLQFVQADISDIQDRLKDDVNKTTKLQELNTRFKSDRYKEYCAPLDLISIAEIHRQLSSVDELDDLALSHFTLFWPTDSPSMKNLELIELPGIGEANWRAARIMETAKDCDVVFGAFHIRDDYLKGLQYMHHYGLINDTSPRLPWIVPMINVSLNHPNTPPSSVLQGDKESIENVRQKMNEALSLSATHSRPDMILFDRMNNSNRMTVAQKVKANTRVLHFYPNTVGSGGNEYNFLMHFESIIRDFKEQKRRNIVQEVMKKSNSFMCLANMFLYRRNISAANQVATRNFKQQLDQDLKEMKQTLDVSLKDIRRKLQCRIEILFDKGTCDFSIAGDFVKQAAVSFTKEWQETLGAHQNQLLERCHTLVCDTKDNEYIKNVKDALESFCISRLEKFEQTISTPPPRSYKQYRKLIKIVQEKNIKAAGKFIDALMKSLPCVTSGETYFVEIQEFAEHLIFTEDGKILGVRMSKKVAEEIREEFNACKKIIRDKYNMAPPRGKQCRDAQPVRIVLAPLPQPQFYETVVKKYTDNNHAKKPSVVPEFFGLKFTEQKTNASVAKNQIVLSLQRNLDAMFNASKSFMNELESLSTRMSKTQTNRDTIAPWFISIAKSEIGSVEHLLQSHTIQDVMTRGEKPVVIVHVKDNDEPVDFHNDCVYQLMIKSTDTLSPFGKVEVIKQLADYILAKYGISYYWFQIGPISTLREYNSENNQMEVTDPARALLLGQLTFLSFRENLVKEQCDFLNKEETKDKLLDIYEKHPTSREITKQLVKTVTPANVQAWMSTLPECAEKTALLKPVEMQSAERIGAVNIANNKDAIYQFNYRTQGKMHYVASRVASSIALFNASMAKRNICKQAEMFVEGGGKKTPNFKALFKSLVKNGCYNLVVFSFEYL